MAGFPTKKIVDFIKKNIVPVFILYGVGSKIMYERNSDYTYKFVYSKNDLERKEHLSKLEQVVNPKH